MKVQPYDEVTELQSGDLVYRYVETAIFMSIQSTELLSADGFPIIEWSGEPLDTLVVAEINSGTFCAWWTLNINSRIGEVPVHGQRMSNEVAVRQLFPSRVEYSYAIREELLDYTDEPPPYTEFGADNE